MDMKWYNRPVAIIGIFIALSILTGLATYQITRQKAATIQTPTTEGATVNDKTTGKPMEENGGGRNPETFGKNPANPILIGFSAFTNLGITESDLNTFQQAITQYFVSTTDYPPASNVSLTNPVCHPPTDSGFINCTYALVINDKITLTGTLKTDLSGPVSVTLNKDATQVFSITLNPAA